MQSNQPGGTFTSAPSPIATAPTAAIAGDILYGADEIAVHLFGDRKYRHRVYNLVDRSTHNLVEGNAFPHFRIGANICARKSVLLEWISAQEYKQRGR